MRAVSEFGCGDAGNRERTRQCPSALAVGNGERAVEPRGPLRLFRFAASRFEVAEHPLGSTRLASHGSASTRRRS